MNCSTKMDFLQNYINLQNNLNIKVQMKLKLYSLVDCSIKDLFKIKRHKLNLQ